MKFYVLVIFTLINIRLCLAQFGKGSQIFSGNINTDFANSNSNSEDFVSPFTKNYNEEKKYGFGLELGYGKFKKENTVLLFGLSYSYSYSESRQMFSDTSKSVKSSGQNFENKYNLFIEKLNFIPIKSNWGLIYSFRGLFGYNTVNSSSKNNFYFSSNDSIVNLEGSSNSNYLQLAASGNLGAYYTINKHFLLFSQINVFTVDLNFNNYKNNYLGNLRKIENSSFGFNLTGALTPAFKLGDISIGIKYLIYKKY